MENPEMAARIKAEILKRRDPNQVEEEAAKKSESTEAAPENSK
jgi:hypothetical protein